ncbi:MAG: 50S ribosomal protein L29 [Elusimicrobiota bacterium]
MAKDKKKIDIKQLTDAELKAELEQAKGKLFKLKFAHKTTPLKNQLEIRTLRRQIARILTVLREKIVKSSQV